MSWKAPALQTVLLKFSDDEVRYIITYGRPFSPMSPWGLAGGGPMNDQQIDSIVAYLHSIQLTPEQAQAAVTKALADAKADPANVGKSDGELLFNMQASSGTYSCARCHTHGWSYDQPLVSGGGAIGPNLTGGSEGRQFPSETDQADFVHDGSDRGKRYGQQRPGHRAHAGLRPDLLAGPDRGSREVRAGTLMARMLASSFTLAFGWQPEIRGILVVLDRGRRAHGLGVPACSRPTSALASGCSSRSARFSAG